MGTISVLNAATTEPDSVELNGAKPGCKPVSLLAFLQAENLRLQNQVVKLQRDTAALREALQKS